MNKFPEPKYQEGQRFRFRGSDERAAQFRIIKVHRLSPDWKIGYELLSLDGGLSLRRMENELEPAFEAVD